MTRTARLAPLALVAALVTGCGGASTGSSSGDTAQQAAGVTVLGDVTTGLTSPWGLAFLPDGSALVSQRDDGSVLRVGTDGSRTVLGTVPGVVHEDEGGLLGIAVDAGFAQDGWLYAYFSTATDNRIARFPVGSGSGSIGNGQLLLAGIPKGVHHNGGRLTFGPDGMLYAGTGDATVKPNAQDMGSLGGKILRLAPDGSVPADNPFPGSLVYSLGHRNVQGLAFDSRGQLWASEFGQDTWDELNKITPGSNDGWPTVEGIAGTDGTSQGFTDPVAQWHPDVASPSGIAIVGDTVLMAALRGQRLWEIPIPGGTAGTPVDALVGQFGRLRTVAAAPDGSVWLITSNTDGTTAAGGNPQRAGDDRIVRLAVAPLGG